MSPMDPQQFYGKALKANDVVTAFGVPDSCLKGLLSYFYATKSISEHIVTANEGAAVMLAAGYYLSTRKLALAYMQNSGLANALNPLQSLAAKEVCGIPMLLMVGWRGKPGEEDEPEHWLAGPITLDTLKINGLPYEIMPETIAGAKEAVARLVDRALKDNTPVALVVPNHTFSEYHGDGAQKSIPNGIATCHARIEDWMSSTSYLPLSREFAIRCLIEEMRDSDVSVSSTGYSSREVYMIRKERGDSIRRNFFSIGAMGHTYAIAYGVAMGYSSGRVFCIDGDGSFLMHAGNNAVLASVGRLNLIHLVIYNGTHCSTGSQALSISKDDFLALAGGLSYQQIFFVDDEKSLKEALKSADKGTLIAVMVNDSTKKTLPRPSESPYAMRDMFMDFLS